MQISPGCIPENIRSHLTWGRFLNCPFSPRFLVFQFDFVELLDGRRLLTQEARSLEGPQRQHKGFVPLASHETGFIQYLDSGMWHLAFYNDGKESEVVSFLTTAVGKNLIFGNVCFLVVFQPALVLGLPSSCLPPHQTIFLAGMLS